MNEIRNTMARQTFLRLGAVVVLWTLGALAGCEGDGRRQADVGSGPVGYPYKITTTVGMVTDIVRQVAGDKAVVTGIIGEAVDPHLYIPSTSDVAKLRSADVVFYSGLLLEGKMSDTLVSVAARVGHVHQVTTLIDESYLLEPVDFSGHFDPHVWMDVAAWINAVDAVALKLSEFDPANGNFYRDNAKTYVAQLRKLDVYVRDTLASIPRGQRLLITAHDAFNYFGRAYDIEVTGIQGLSTESEAALERINRLVDIIVERDVKAVFVESSVSPKSIEALREGAANRGHEVAEGGTLFSDAMGPPDTYEGSYIGMIDHNATVVARALGGKAPPRGMQGKLTLIRDGK